MSTVIVIPARYASSRFPGKPLALLNGVSLIERCFRSAAKVPGVAAVHVATDDRRIADHIADFGGSVLMTPESCENGTARCAAALALLPEEPEIVINWQGDSPLIEAAYVAALVGALRAQPEAELVTPVIRCDEALFCQLRDERQAGRVGGVAVVRSASGRALYFSRELIPWSDQIKCADEHGFFFHIGMYGYRPAVLRQYRDWPVGPLERVEQLEQLRFIEQDRHVAAVKVPGRGHWEVNYPEDVPLVEKLLAEHKLD